jgi:putative endonuclease
MPESHRNYWVYILTNKPHGTLYVGVTNSLERRIWQHKSGSMEGFTKRYGLNRLVHMENFRDVTNAIAREKELKGWLRSKKTDMIQAANPLWKDLAEGWYSIPSKNPCRPSPMSSWAKRRIQPDCADGTQLDPSLCSG